jgi:hypothetical protein
LLGELLEANVGCYLVYLLWSLSLGIWFRMSVFILF